MRGRRCAVAIALALGTCHEAQGPLADFTPAPSSLSIVLITLDTLRADRLGCYGFPGNSTPNLDALAKEGVLFEQATSTVPLTLPSHASILTGLLPPHHGVRDNGGVPLPDSRTTLAERFQKAGYATGGFVGSWVLERRFGVAQGFERYSDRFGADELQKRGDAVMEDALAWIDEVRAQRFFAWVHLFDPHLPYDPPEPFRSRFGTDRYQGEVAFTDELVGRIVSRLRERGLLERTLVVVTADHGESLGEHGEANHGFFVYDATVAVPLIVRTPWGLRGKRRTQVSLVDVFPTVLDLAGLPAEPGIDGQSLVPALLDPGRDLGHVAYSESLYPRFHYGWHELRALRDGAWKLVDAPRVELYDLARDPGEKENLARAKARTAEEMRVALRRKVPADDPAAAAARPALDPETQQRLAALGYVGSAVATDPEDGARRSQGQDRSLREDHRGQGGGRGGTARRGDREDASRGRGRAGYPRCPPDPRGLAPEERPPRRGDRPSQEGPRPEARRRDGGDAARRGLPRSRQARGGARRPRALRQSSREEPGKPARLVPARRPAARDGAKRRTRRAPSGGPSKPIRDSPPPTARSARSPWSVAISPPPKGSSGRRSPSTPRRPPFATTSRA